MDRIIQLGLDYGTSSSKLIFRDYDAPGGERAYILKDDDDDYRFPSTVYFDTGTDCFYFGKKTSPKSKSGRIIRYDSIKMRVAEEVKGEQKYFFGERISFPEGFDARSIAILTIWYLLSVSNQRILRYLKNKEFKLTVTMGIPMNFYNDLALKNEFLNIIRLGQFLFNIRPMPTNKGILRSGVLKGVQFAKESISRDIVSKDSIRSWIRTEAESALLWAYNSPHVGEGLYAKIDVGAGTTNSSVFTIQTRFDENFKRWVKSGMAFFYADSISVGMDAVGSAIIKDIQLEKALFEIRGNENKYIDSVDSLGKDTKYKYNEIFNLFQSVWQKSYMKYSRQEEWRSLKIFIFGGGGLVRSLVDSLKYHPDKNARHWSNGIPPLPIIKLEAPDDVVFLDGGRKPSRDELNFLLVAYGLSNNHLSVPQIRSPQDVKSVPPLVRSVREIEDHENFR